MKPRKLGMIPAILPDTTPQIQPKGFGKKRSATKSRQVGCIKCGIAHTTLRKTDKGYMCQKCYAKRGGSR